MAPVGVFYRPKGEEVILHRCLGCGLERHCRVAADDNPLVIAELPLVTARVGHVDTANGKRQTAEDDVSILEGLR
jgi:hypothetical protein